MHATATHRSTAQTTKKTHPVIIKAAYNGSPFLFQESGHFNMTKAAKEFGKALDDFWKNRSTKQYIAAISSITGLSPDLLIQSKRGNGGGTWAHPKLAVFFARWLDVRFSVWCDMTIDSILKGKLEVAPARGHEEDPEVARLVAP